MEYTAELKAEALRRYSDEGVAAVADSLQIPRGTLSVWVHRSGVERVHPLKTEAATEARVQLQAEIRAEVQLAFLTEAWESLQQAHDAKPQDRVKLVTAAAVAIDKYRLEMGEATTRTITESADDTDRSIQQLVAEMERRSQTKAS